MQSHLVLDWKEDNIKSMIFNKNKYTAIPLDETEKTSTKNSFCAYLSSYLTKKNISAAVFILILSMAFVLVACIGGNFQSKVCTDHSTVQFTGSLQNRLDHLQKNLKIAHSKRRLPHCIIIGVRKGGTRALLQFLKIHPDIQVAPDEIHFFDNNENYSKGIDWYRRRMPQSFEEQLTIEKSPNYFLDWNTPYRVKMMNSSIKLLLIVRDPLYRAVSDYAQIKEVRDRKGMEMKEFEDLAINSDTGKVKIHYKAINRSLYYIHTKRWLKQFPLNQIHIVDGDNLVLHPFEEMEKVESFLGLRHYLQEDHFVYDRKKGFYCINKENGDHKCLNRTKGRPHPKIDPEVEDQLNKFFEPYNQQFFQLVGKTFKWPKQTRRRSLG
ncbi:heparan sulfate glucosamine 3-O-sulfotransferase 5-like [Saccostrea echinata]|uniref:heparan sulfate glucosamine 3-O-sulfotransferase 5-like n=1 Tax=Saccostrea echinata TaxID=191078 RepID=UPI002A80AAF4|nr:heparan sulfate glucosamine 3-O-sulfotransferase 5-like [Saccostrea echinata]